MTIFISLVIFGLGLFLFFITNEKLKKIKDNLLIDDTKKELESLITEFNSAAARNIELLESKISELQEMINRANSKMAHLDDKIGRANRPILVEKIVDKSVTAPAKIAEPAFSTYMKPEAVETKSEPVRNAAVKTAKPAFQPAKSDKKNAKAAVLKKEPPRKEMKKSAVENQRPDGRTSPAPVPAETRTKTETPVKQEPLTRHEQLKRHIQEGLSKEELIALGFMENEINLLNFLIKKKV